MSEEIKFDFNEDIIYQIEMMSYMNYNDRLCSINEHFGEIYSYQDLQDMEQAQLHYEKDLTYKAIKQLQDLLKQKENIIKEVKAQLDYLETYSSKEDVYEDMKKRLNRIEKIIGE